MLGMNGKLNLSQAPSLRFACVGGGGSPLEVTPNRSQQEYKPSYSRPLFLVSAEPIRVYRRLLSRRETAITVLTSPAAPTTEAAL